MNYVSNVCLSTVLVQLKLAIFNLFVDGKDGAYRCQAVDVGGAIQRIKTHHIFSLQTRGGVELVAYIIYIIGNQTPTNQPTLLKKQTNKPDIFNAVLFL